MKRLDRAIKKLERTLVLYWLPITLGCIITGILVLVMAGKRGAFAIGGEWFIIPVFCYIHYMIRRHFREKARKEKIRRQRNGKITRLPRDQKTA